MTSKGRLGLNLFEANLKRHPSVKGLFDEDGNKKKSPMNSKNELLILNVDNKSEKESDDTSNNHDEEIDKEKEIEKEDEKVEIEEKETGTKNKKEKIKAIPVKINRVEEKMVDNTNSFFTELNDDEIKQIKRNREKFKTSKNNKLIVPLSYEFNNSQKELDRKITNAMSQGQKYEDIEDKLKTQLKKK